MPAVQLNSISGAPIPDSDRQNYPTTPAGGFGSQIQNNARPHFQSEAHMEVE